MYGPRLHRPTQGYSICVYMKVCVGGGGGGGQTGAPIIGLHRHGTSTLPVGRKQKLVDEDRVGGSYEGLLGGG